MFKKLKDKIAEEVKQSPLKNIPSMQQLTQVMTNNSSFTSEINDVIEEETDQTRELAEVNTTSEYDSSFTTVDLKSPTPPRNRRLSSTSSIASDLFLTYDFTPNRYNLQSDLESNSEFDDGSSIHQFNNITKENLYEKYRIMLQKYHKYRGRFVDLQKYCKELQRENNKAKNVLTESQDKAIRRITELKEQCTLEQEAKAHLEEALRSELEEKDHLIETLNTKIELLKGGKDCDQSSQLLETSNSVSESMNSDAENLKNKIKSYEALLSKAKDSLTQKSTQIQELNIKIDSDRQAYEKKISKLELDLKNSNERITSLQKEIDLMRRKEEESALSLAENKLAVHKELEAKEMLIRNLENKIFEYEKETKKLRAKHEVEPSDDNSSEEMKKLQKELVKFKTDLEETRTLRNNDSALLKQKDALIDEFRATVNSSNEELFKLKKELQNFDLQVINKKSSEKDDIAKELEQSQSTIKKLELSFSKKHKEFSNFRSEKELQVSQLEEQLNNLNEKLISAQTELAEKDLLLSNLKADFDKVKSTTQNGENEKVIELEKTLLATKDQYSRDKKNREEIETNLKADKIVLEEIVKNTQNELKSLQVEFQNATKKIADYEQQLKSGQDSKQQVIDLNERLERLTNDLNKTKQSEQGVSEKMATLLEQINDLKAKEDEHLIENRKLKDTIKTLKIFENETRKLKETLLRKNEEIDKLKALEQQISRMHEELLSKEKTIGDLAKFEHEVKTLNLELASKNEIIRELENSKKDIVSLKVELDSKNEIIKKLSEYETEVESLKEQLLTKDSSIESLKIFENQVKTLTENLSLKDKEIESLKLSESEKLSSISGKIEALNSEIKSKNAEIERLKVFENEVKFLNEQLNSENEAVEELKNLNDEIKSLSEEVLGKSSEIQKFEHEIKSLNEKLSSKDKSLEKLETYKNELKILNEKLRDKNQQIEKMKGFESRMKSLEDDIKAKEEEISSLKKIQNEVKLLNEDLHLKNETIENLKQQIKSLNDSLLDKVQELDTLKTFENQSKELQTKIAEQSEEMNRILESHSNEILSLTKTSSHKDTEIENYKSEISRLTEILDPTKKEIMQLRGELENQTSKYENLFEQRTTLDNSLKSNESKFESYKKQSAAEIERLKAENLFREKEYAELKSTFDDVKLQLEELDNLRNVNKMLMSKDNQSCDKIDQLNTELGRLNSENKRLQDQLDLLNVALKNTENKLENIQKGHLINAQSNDSVLLGVQNKVSQLKSDYMKMQYDLKHDISILKQYCCDYKEDIYTTSNKIIQNQIISIADTENKLRDLTSQFDVCKSENNSLKNDKKELLIKVNDLSNLLNKLEKKLNDQGNIEEYRKNLKNLEDRQDAEIRQITFDYETKLKQKEKEYEILENKLFMISDEENAFAMEENHQIIKSLQEEISQKNEAYEKLFEEHGQLEQKFNGEKDELKKSYENEIKQNDRKWRACLDKMLLEVEDKYKDEINELTKEWSKDRKSDLKIWQNENNNLEQTSFLKNESDKPESESEPNLIPREEVSPEFLENTANKSGDSEALKKQVQVLFNELNTYKKLHRKDDLSSCNSSRSDIAFDDPVNMEHLRNILYKYMMGIEQSAAARVLAEIVKFDNEQTRQILDKVKPKRSSVVKRNESPAGLMANFQNMNPLFNPSMYPILLLALKNKFRFNPLRIKEP
ncbi:golgin subfamily A member 4-like isoform X2 [Planococcus citri]|uniref:golgin subfamily A member 4-like isoform X2 n=1 Tax=Planococcus citri TaxID=170843 RepID=UPI0031F83CA7